MAQRRKLSGELGLAGQPADVDELVPAGIAPAISADAAPPRHEGQITGIEGDKIVGWAWDASRPYDPVDVELFVASLRVGHGSARHFDIELAKAKRGNGMHRFELSLDRLPPGPPPYVVRAVVTGSEKELLPAITLSTIDDAERLLSGHEYMGKVTGIVDGTLCGWVVSALNPHEQPTLTLRDGDTDVLSRPAGGRIDAAIDSGATIEAYRFELPLPANILDGRPHFLSVLVGSSDRELAGSPLMFGPADVASIGQSLAMAFEKLQQLDSKMVTIQPNYDPALLEQRMTVQILDRVDMLLNIHRDGLERELAVLRRQVTELIQRSPKGEPDVIRPIAKVAAIEDERMPAASWFTTFARSAPLISYDLEAKSETAKLSAGFKWSNSAASPGVSITGSGSIALDGIPSGPVSLILDGVGASDPVEFCSMMTALHGRPLVGSVEIAGNGDWTFSGTTVEGSIENAGTGGLAFTYLTDLFRPSGRLTLRRIAVFRHRRAPAGTNPAQPQAMAIYVGNESRDSGWYSVEVGPLGGLCWMGGRAELAFRVRQTGAYRLRIPQVRALVPDIMSKLRISLCGVGMQVEVSPSKGDPNVFAISAEGRIPLQSTGALTVRLSFPDDCVRSPKELGLNTDQRPLTLAISAAALAALDS
jgi:hypothetical protein